ncbi:hypothetical protein TeGR_g6367 [Tetraparma gracilis]|uniref:Vesicle transport protein n=1 Tax=Tetraparma gracilis TaxID=2962635 RepID=A0ABQ6MZE9_9STRA|nr:hypothetical protein TeGR_g6367 [Tetraparma gracilis]
MLNPNREKTWQEQVEEEVCSVCPSLTYTQRITGCLSCAAIGMLLSFGSFFRFTALLKGNPTPFAVCFTLGSIVSLCGTCFLSGPYRQAKSMCAKTRIGATVMYIGSMIATLAVAFACGSWPAQGLLILICVVLQYISIIWYTLSYIPFARQWAKSCCTSMCCSEEMC